MKGKRIPKDKNYMIRPQGGSLYVPLTKFCKYLNLKEGEAITVSIKEYKGKEVIIISRYVENKEDVI